MTREIFGRLIVFKFNHKNGFPGDQMKNDVLVSLLSYKYEGECIDHKWHMVGFWYTKKDLI